MSIQHGDINLLNLPALDGSTEKEASFSLADTTRSMGCTGMQWLLVQPVVSMNKTER